MTAHHSWGEAVSGPGDPWKLQQLALGSPFKCFQLWQGVRETLHCKTPLKNPQTLGRGGSQLVQNGFQKPGHKSEIEAQGGEAGAGELGLPRGVGSFGFQTLGCAFGQRKDGEGSWEAGRIDRLPHLQGTGVPGSERGLPLGSMAA